jgi:multiple sugar transport system substrate-binding protein
MGSHGRPAGALRRYRLWWAVAAVAVLGGVGLIVVPRVVADPPDAGPIIILSGRDQSRGGQRAALIEKWNRDHPESIAKLVELSPIADAQRSEMLARAQAGGGVDIYNLDVTWTAEFAAAGYIQSLDSSTPPAEDFLAGFLEGPLQTCRYDDRLWALPFNTDVGLLYYNKQLLGSDEPPRTWPSLLDQVRQVRQARGDVAGYVGQYGDYEGLTVTALELIWGAGGEVIDDEGRLLPAPTAVLTGLDRLAMLTPPTVPPYDEAGSTQAFRDGTALFMRNWPVAYQDLTSNPEDPPPDFGVAPLPERSAALGGQNLAIAADTDRAEEAHALIKFLTGDLSQAQLYGEGGLPATRKAVYDDQPFAATLREALDNARSRPALPHYAQFSQSLRTTVDEYLRRGELPSEDALRERLDAARHGRVVPG